MTDAKAANERRSPTVPRISKCPVCGYSLRGLPAAHRCPECAFPYDPQTRIWRPLKPKAIFGGLIGFIAGLGGLTRYIVRDPSIGIPLLVLWVGLALYVGRRCYLIYQRGQFVCVGQEGIHLRLHSADAQFVPWEEVAAIHRQRYDKFCRIERTGEQKEIPVAGVFSSPADVVEFTDLANQRLTAHRKALASEDATG